MGSGLTRVHFMYTILIKTTPLQSEDEFVITTEMMDLLTPDMSSVLKRDDLVVEVFLI